MVHFRELTIFINFFDELFQNLLVKRLTHQAQNVGYHFCWNTSSLLRVKAVECFLKNCIQKKTIIKCIKSEISYIKQTNHTTHWDKCIAGRTPKQHMFYETHHIYESYFWLHWFVYTVCVYRNKSNWFFVPRTCFFFPAGDLFCWHKYMFTISFAKQQSVYYNFCKNRMTIISRGNNPLFWALFCFNWLIFFCFWATSQKSWIAAFLPRESLLNQKKSELRTGHLSYKRWVQWIKTICFFSGNYRTIFFGPPEMFMNMSLCAFHTVLGVFLSLAHHG